MRRLPCAFFPYSQAAAAPPPPPPPPLPPRISGAEGRKEEAPPPPRCVAETTVGRFSSSSSFLPHFAGKNMGIPPTYQDGADASASPPPPAEKIHRLPQARSGGRDVLGHICTSYVYARHTSIILGNVKKRVGLDSHSANEWFFCFHSFLFIRGFQDSVYLSSKNSCTWK